MNEPKQEHDKIERLLEASRVAGPSESLKERVTGAARAAWEQAPAEVPWQIPVWRLLVSAAAAAIIIACGNHLGDITLHETPSSGPAAAGVANPELEELAQTIYGSARNRLGAGRRRGPESQEATLRDRIESVQQILDEMENNGVYGQPTRSGGRSRLLRRRESYS